VINGSIKFKFKTVLQNLPNTGSSGQRLRRFFAGVTCQQLCHNEKMFARIAAAAKPNRWAA